MFSRLARFGFSTSSRGARVALGFTGAASALTFSQVTYSAAPSVDYNKVREDILDIMDDLDYDDGSYGPILIRLAWHSSGSYSKHDNSGGSNNATMRFSPERDYGGNAGLHVARDLLESVKAKHPGITYADLYTLAGCVAVEAMAGPKIEWTPGRVDSADNSPTAPDGRLPDAAQGAQHVRDVMTRMGFDDREAVVLSGAHCFGRCHTDRSGFDGPWTNAPTTFSNLYFVELLKDQWVERSWNGPTQFEDTPSRQLMMLPTDMAMKTDPVFRVMCEEYAQDEDRFAKDFAPAFAKLMNLGHPKISTSYTPYVFGGLLAALIATSK